MIRDSTAALKNPLQEEDERMDLDPYRDYTVTETCPHCGNQNELWWDTSSNGYEIYCPRCGKKMLLCDACLHAEDNKGHKCDWSKGKECWRMKND
ncbi:MAG: hypothetical protein ACLUFC_08980 [Anaerobutyricum hallii]|uniref:hypothetical protein n=1 Tax=Anaerobutyricum hallii TaxID=39488 RepID=UPI003995D69F